MSTITQTYTRTDIRKVFENFQANLQMLAIRTQAMGLEHAQNHAYDILLMAQEECLSDVHVQLYDFYGHLVRVYRYSVVGGIVSDSQRPGENRWPRLPNGTLCVLIKCSDNQKFEKLKQSRKLKLNWGPSSLSTNDSGMRNDGVRLYSSNNYGLQRNTFVGLKG